jgi:transposase/3-methyladenine DNA glycosylase AlkC
MGTVIYTTQFIFIYFLIVMGKHKSLDYKETVVEYYRKTNSLKQACEPFGCNKMTLWRWIQRAESGDLNNKKRTGAYKVTEEMVDRLLEDMKANPDITLAQMQEMIQREFGVLLSQRHLARVIRDNNFTLKQKNKRHFPEHYRNQPRNQKEEINTFLTKVRNHPMDKIISIDETSIVSGMSRNQGRQLIGKRLVEQTSHPDRFKKKTLVMAISANGVEGWTMYDKGGMTSERMVEFLQKVLKDKDGYMVVMDNAATHGTQDVRKLISETGNKLQHTVPYSPQLNAVEEFFNQFKHYIRRKKPQHLSELKDAVHYSLNEIKKRGCCTNYFVHAYKEKRDVERKHKLRPKKKYKVEE